MRDIIFIVGLCIVLPVMALEAIIKTVMIVLLCPIVLCIGVIYPVLRKTRVLVYLDKYTDYAFKWRKGFTSGRLMKYWE
jgi:uncharacterized membrane protein